MTHPLPFFDLVCQAWSLVGLPTSAPTTGLIPRWPVMLAEMPMPDPQSSEAVKWIAVALISLVVLLGAAASAVLAILGILDRIRGRRETMAVDGEIRTSPSNRGPSREEFNFHVKSFDALRDERKEDVVEMKATLKEIKMQLEGVSGELTRDLSWLIRRVNTLENGMTFLAGKMERDGDPDAERLQRLISNLLVKEEA